MKKLEKVQDFLSDIVGVLVGFLIEERLKKEPDLLMAIFEEGNELDRFLIQEGHEPKFSAYIALALEKASIDAYNKKSISIGRLNDIRWNLLNLAPISGKI